MKNPLIEPFNTQFETVPFEEIQNSHFLPAIKWAIAEGKKEIEAIISNPDAPTFANVIEALENSGTFVSRVSEIFYNLNSAETNEEIQKIAHEFSPLLSEYGNDIMLNSALFDKVKAVYDAENPGLTKEQQMLLTKTYRAFSRNGANLNEEDKTALREMDKTLAGLSLKFGENVLAETNDFEMVISNEEDLKGLPESTIEAAAEAANEKGMDGKWVFTLDYPSYIPFITYAENRSLREEMTKAFGSRAFKNNDRNNEAIVLQLAKLRQERAQLLGFKNHADYMLQERMAESADNVLSFLEKLLVAAKPFGQKEVEELKDFAANLDGIEDLKKWDFGYYSEKVKQQKFDIDDDTLKPYFSLEDVNKGAFTVAEKLYGISFKERTDIQKYHKDVKTYEVLDSDGSHLAVLYADFFPRPGKRNGAWMTSYRNQKMEGEKNVRPHISIVCNFTKPTKTKPSLLTFQEVLTLFHEFGHALHGILANGTYASLSGTSVFWDFVELPSQIMENWCYEKECLDLFAKHYQTGEKIPSEIVERLKSSATFLEGYATVRQVSLARIDMSWHAADVSAVSSVPEYEAAVLKETDLIENVPGSNVSTSFSHIFQGGYSAGYYSYKWAEVLDADAFEYFLQKGIFNQEVASKFRELLAAGGSQHPAELYRTFRGQDADPVALLRRAGLVASDTQVQV